LALSWGMGVPGEVQAVDADKVNVEAFAMWNAAMAKGDFDKAASFFAENGVRIHPVAGEIKGRKAMRDFFAGLDKDWADQHCTVTWHTGNGNRAAAAFYWEAKQRSSGKAVKLPIVLITEWDEKGKQTWSHEYFDTGAFAKQLE